MIGATDSSQVQWRDSNDTEIPVRYVPWPEDGCTLAEARERTADRVLWANWRARIDAVNLSAEAEALELEINSQFKEMLQCGRLVAVGRSGTATAEPAVIPAIAWPTLDNADWSASKVEERRPGGVSVHDVRLFPAVFGPTRISVLAGLTMIEAVQRHVLGDPEVVALSAAAIVIEPRLERVFKRGHWGTHGSSLWPLILFDLPADLDEDDILFEWPLGSMDSPPEVHAALRTLETRFEWLLRSLRDGSLAMEGLPVRPGDPVRVPRSVWSHRDFSLDLEEGDLFEDNHRPEHKFDGQIKRWSALMICRGDIAVASEIQALEPSTQAISAEVVMDPPSPRRSRQRPKSDPIRGALKAANIDLATDPRGSSAIAAAIAGLVPWEVKKAQQLEALAKNISRLRRELA